MSETTTKSAQHLIGAQHRYLVFMLGEEHYGVPLLSVKEVIALPEFTPVPYTPSHFLGVMNLRGQVISVIDLRNKFGIKAQNSSETVVIICDLAPVVVGVVVNSVDYVVSLHEKDIQPRPQIESKKSTEYLSGVARKDQHLILLLDLAKALDVEDRVAINQVNQKKAA